MLAKHGVRLLVVVMEIPASLASGTAYIDDVQNVWGMLVEGAGGDVAAETMDELFYLIIGMLHDYCLVR